MDLVIQVQIIVEALCISLHDNTLMKGMNQLLSSIPCYEQMVGQTKFSSLVVGQSSFGEGKALNSKPGIEGL